MVHRDRDLILGGSKVEDLTVPADVKTCKENLFTWLSDSVDQLNLDQTGVAHCWESTRLLEAWERPVQAEALRKATDLFPNLDSDDATTDPTTTEDEQAFCNGAAFMEAGHDDEWEGWVDWEGDAPDDDAQDM